MALDIQYTWNFNPLESYPTASGHTDVVFRIHWQLYGSTGSYQASSIGVETVSYDTGSVFIPFEELTFDTVYNWITASMGMDQINALTASLAQQIEDKINPPVLIQQPPWLVPTPSPSVPV